MSPCLGGDFLHGKIMSFGGGFYGTMSVMSYLVIEIVETGDFLGKIVGPGNWTSNIGFDLIIGFIINSFTNLIAVFLWFQTLLDYLPVEIGWIWLAAAYLGYLAGVKVTILYGDSIWPEIKKTLVKLAAWIKTRYR